VIILATASSKRIKGLVGHPSRHPKPLLPLLLGRGVRILVTGSRNPVGRAVALALAKDGHQVRVFGIEPGSTPFQDSRIECYPGWLHVGGSLEPVLSECQALIHCANLDAPGDDKQAHAVHLERGTLYARYAAEREPVGAFVAVFPPSPGRTWGKAVAAAREHVEGTRRLVPTTVVESDDPDTVVAEARAAIARAAPKISV
jgi:NAD(P)-dependent dehydrogenase (short-subunit alcohol dehydrogenase family)